MKLGEKAQDFIKESNRSRNITGRCFIAAVVIITIIITIIVSMIEENLMINLKTMQRNVGEMEKVVVDILMSEEEKKVENEILRNENVSEEKMDVDIELGGVFSGIEDENVVEKDFKVSNIEIPNEEIKEEEVCLAIYMNEEDINSHSNLSLEDIEVLVASFEELKGVEEAIYKLDVEDSINAFFTLAVLRLESGNGVYTSGENNYFNVTNFDGEWVNYASRGESIEAFGKLIKEQYIAEDGLWYEEDMIDGVSLEEIERHYCPLEDNDCTIEDSWSNRVYNLMEGMYYRVNKSECT